MPNLRDITAYAAALRLELRESAETRKMRLDRLRKRFILYQALLPDEIITDSENNNE